MGGDTPPYFQMFNQGEIVPGRMIRKGKWKLICYANKKKYDLLFNLEKDPHELTNVIAKYLEQAETLRKLVYKDWEIERIKENYKIKKEQHKILSQWGENVDYEEKERWHIPSNLKQIDEDNFI